jgi:RND superfamily putative drug exporter
VGASHLATCEQLVVAGWIAVVVGVGALAGALKGHTDDAFNVPGTQSQQALTLLDAKFPGTGGADARIVFAAPPGHKLTDPQYNDLVEPTVKLVQQVPQTVGAGTTNLKSPLTLSKDQTIGFADIHFAVPVDKLSQQTKDALERVADPVRKAGLGVEFSGGVISTSSSGGHSNDVIGLLIAFVVLYFVFGALLVAGLPLISALTGVAVGLLGLTALTGVVTLNSTTPTLALMLGLAVGIDYALFIVSRHRQHLDEGMSVEDSVIVGRHRGQCRVLRWPDRGHRPHGPARRRDPVPVNDGPRRRRDRRARRTDRQHDAAGTAGVGGPAGGQAP